MLTPSESKLLSLLCIYPLPGFWMSVIHFRIKLFPFMKYSVSFHHPIICNVLKNLNPVFLSINITVCFVFNSRMEYRKQNHPDDNGIESLMQWLKLSNIRKSQLIIPSTLRYSLMELCPVLMFLLMKF